MRKLRLLPSSQCFEAVGGLHVGLSEKLWATCPVKLRFMLPSVLIHTSSTAKNACPTGGNRQNNARPARIHWERQLRQRIIVCPLIQNEGAYLLCKMPQDRGVFPGQWALSGGGLEPGERIEEGLRREIREELGDRLQITEIQPWTFRDDVRTKSYAGGSTEELHMIYLIFDCQAANRDVIINEEFDDYAWVKPQDLKGYDLNEATRSTFAAKGVLPG